MGKALQGKKIISLPKREKHQVAVIFSFIILLTLACLLVCLLACLLKSVFLCLTFVDVTVGLLFLTLFMESVLMMIM